MFSALALIMLLTFTSERIYGDSVTQTKRHVTIQEGKHVLLPCNYDTSSSPFLFWYEQQPNNPPQLLLSSYDGQDAETKRRTREFSAKLNKAEKSFNLTKDSVELRDTAAYFCALSDIYDNYKLTLGSGTRLTVAPNLEDSPPSIYELRPDASAGGEKKDKAACLITDYFPNPLKVKSKEGEKEVEVNGSVVVVKEEDAEKGTGSYGIVLWGDKDDNFHCAASDKNGQKFESNTADDPGTCLAESGDNGAFETDERLNLLSLTVLGLRVVFLKSVAFNLLLTFRLWSRGG